MLTGIERARSDRAREQGDNICFTFVALVCLVTFASLAYGTYYLINAAVTEDDDEQSAVDSVGAFFFGGMFLFGCCWLYMAIDCPSNNADQQHPTGPHAYTYGNTHVRYTGPTFGITRPASRSDSATPESIFSCFRPLCPSDPYYGVIDIENAKIPDYDTFSSSLSNK
jgi:hypothetical protein